MKAISSKEAIMTALKILRQAEEERLQVAKNEAERFLYERDYSLCECGGILAYPAAWNGSYPPMICQTCGKVYEVWTKEEIEEGKRRANIIHWE